MALMDVFLSSFLSFGQTDWKKTETAAPVLVTATNVFPSSEGLIRLVGERCEGLQ